MVAPSTPITPEDLHKIHVFTGIHERAVELCAEKMLRIAAPAGSSILRQGEAAFKFFVVLSGVAAVIADGDEVAEVGPGDIVGEVALLSGHKRNADVVARTNMTLGALMVWDFRAICDAEPDLAEAITSIARTRIC